MKLAYLRKLVNPFLRARCCETFLSNCLSRMSGSRSIEKRDSWGEDYPDETFYVIRRPNQWGLMSILVMYLRYFDYALRRGWIPVVDMKTIPNLYSENDEAQDSSQMRNSWEFFFDQPCGYGLEDIAHAKNIVISSHHLLLSDDLTLDWDCLENNRLLEKWRKLASNTIQINTAAKRYIDSMRESISPAFQGGKSVLGVYCRGTDYTGLKPKGHAVQPCPEMVITKTREMMGQYGYSTVYLVTEDAEVLEQFKRAFSGDMLLYLDVKRYHNTNDFIWKDDEMLCRSRIKNGLEYLASMKLLAECDSFIGGLTGGTAALLLMRDRDYTHQILWNLGRY